MQRDWDVIREILVRLEEKGPDDQGLRAVDFGEHRSEIVAYNAYLLHKAGLIDAEILETDAGPDDFIGLRLTFEGHELLDAIRSDTVWQKTKESFAAKGVSMTLDLVKDIAVKFAAELMTRT